MYLKSSGTPIGFVSAAMWQPDYKIRTMLQLSHLGRMIRYVTVTIIGVEYEVRIGQLEQTCHVATHGLNHEYLHN